MKTTTKKNFRQPSGFSVKKTNTRKEQRKEQRQMKKRKKEEFFAQRREMVSGEQLKGPYNPNRKREILRETVKPETPVEIPVKTPKPVPSISTLAARERRKEKKLNKGMKKQRSKMLLQANEEEDKTIKHLEKLLGLNKRKSKSLPKEFSATGLDYILDVCDPEKMKDAMDAGKIVDDEAFDDDLALITGAKRPRKEFTEKKTTRKESEEEESNDEVDDDDDDDDDEENLDLNTDDDVNDYDEEDLDLNTDEELESQGDGLDHVEDDIMSNQSDPNELSCGEDEDEAGSEVGVEVEPSTKPKSKSGEWEDIYGRKRDKDGNVIDESSAYVPPHLRMTSEGGKNKDLDRLRKQLKGLLNRVAENNMHNISVQIENLYMSNSRNDMNETLFRLLMEAIVSRVITPERLAMEHAMLVAILHANIGSEIGAYILQHCAKKFDELCDANHPVENKELDNIALILVHLYTFEICQCDLVYDVLNRLCDKFEEKEVEVILLILRNVGFSLRKDDPAALKNFILRVQKLASDTKLASDSRVKFMVDVLVNIKNNNMKKLPQYDPTLAQHLKKAIKPMIRKGNYVTTLKISLKDLLLADQRGRWWVVGSAWSGGHENAQTTEVNHRKATKLADQVMDLAKKQRMNSANRKNIFSILMTAEDYLDATERLLKLGLKGQPEQEIIHVILHCVQQEADFNPYYALIAKQLTICDRRHQMSLQYAVWDRFKELNSQNETQITNLAKFLAFLFIEKALPISILKGMNFAELNKTSMRLMRQIILSLLLHKDEAEMLAVFTRIAQPKTLAVFRESLKLFLHHFIIKNLPKTQNDSKRLQEKIELVQQALS